MDQGAQHSDEDASAATQPASTTQPAAGSQGGLLPAQGHPAHTVRFGAMPEGAGSPIPPMFSHTPVHASMPQPGMASAVLPDFSGPDQGSGIGQFRSGQGGFRHGGVQGGMMLDENMPPTVTHTAKAVALS